MKQKKRIAALFLAWVMLFSSMPLSAVAVEKTYGPGLCRHHPEHTEDCGYRRAEPGTPCGHEHTEDCYRPVTSCIHEHTEACFQEKDPGQDQTATGSDARITGIPSACTHVCSQESGCITLAPDCGHSRGEHTEECGYTEGTPGLPCTYECEICGAAAQWPEAPGLPEGPAEGGGLQSQIYGKPGQEMTAGEAERLRTLSLKAPVTMNPDKEIQDEGLDGPVVFIYVNGEAYQGGSLEVTRGDNFSYMASWSPNVRGGKPFDWNDGSWFERTLFQVPGLNLINVPGRALSIGGVKVGEYSLTYDRTTGEMKYKVVFNKYIHFFDPETILAFVQGSGKFEDTLDGKPIELGDKSGTLTVVPRPELPDIPVIPGGAGWQPPKAPEFEDKTYPFGKGVKWNSSSDPAADPQIEWRVVFLEQLQKLQQEFLEKMKDPDYELPESDGYVIIEDTLDVNQKFYHPENEENKYGEEAPFFLELPVMVPGTGTILNGIYGAGSGSYDGPGEIYTVFGGDKFLYIECKSTSPQEITKAKSRVKKMPLSWTVTRDPSTGQETLLINAGKLGTRDPREGVTWDAANLGTEWPEKGLEDLVKKCDRIIGEIEAGENSPIELLNQRATALLQLVERHLAGEYNRENQMEIQEQKEEWYKDYEAWHSDPQTGPLAQLEDEKGELVVQLPDPGLAEALKSCKTNGAGGTVGETQEYRNYIKSLENLREDQKIYLKNRTQYKESWEQVKSRYENTRKFYEGQGVYGFVVKVRTMSINTSMDKYSNTVKVTLDQKKWSADDEASAAFAGGIIGSYNVGDVVIQKADRFYATKENDQTDIQSVTKDNAGLAGAEFQMYCGGENGNPPEQEDDNRAWFLDKDASANGRTYRYTHTGKESISGIRGDQHTLKIEAGDEGRLAVSGLLPAHDHWLVETKAPEGYYLDPDPVKVECSGDSVTYQLLPNVSRSVKLEKTDSFSGNPVEGAEFGLYRKKDGNETQVTGFVKKDLNGHETYWRSDSGLEPLKTSEDGVLCIHGLEAGDYVLKEKKPAPGYETPQNAQKYEFTLDKKLPEDTRDPYDEDYHYLLTEPNDPLTNDPGTGSLEMTKVGISNTPLPGAAFALFRFKGTEKQWMENPDKEELWEAVDLSMYKPAEGTAADPDAHKYFQTKNQIQEVKVSDGIQESPWQGKKFQAAVTNRDGKINITQIPLGHYSIAEVEAPTTYVRDFRSFYFRIGAEETQAPGTSAALYLNPEHTSPVRDNCLKNYQKKAKLALVKYDEEKGLPGIQGDPLDPGDPEGSGWHYTNDVLKESSVSGLPGAVYKLFMRRGASSGGVNPHWEQLETEEILKHTPGYDTCVAVGTTDARGVLKLEEMKGRNENKITGLNPEEYYMIEITAPEGYALDQKPVYFSLDERVFPDGQEEGEDPGLVMAVSNKKMDYGLRLKKVDSETGDGLAGAEFSVKKGEETLTFTEDAGSYRLSTASNASQTVASGEDGRLTVTGLEPGTEYTFTETKAPRGYEPLKAPFSMITGKSEKDGTLEDGVLFPEEKKVSNTRLKGKVLLHKQAAETGEPLSGAEFSLYKTEVTTLKPEDPGYDPTNPGGTRSEDVLVQTAETGPDGDLAFEGLEWSDHYYIIETKAPEGYMLDQTKRLFSIDADSFYADGQPVPVRFPAVSNSKGTLGRAVLVKADADDHEKRLEDAHFYLEKYMGADGNGKEYWVGYGQGMYMTDEKGEIRFLLPPGDYRLTEMKAPDGYLIGEMDLIPFTIPETEEGQTPQEVIIDEAGSSDGVITNRKGGSGVLLKKTIEGTQIPVKGAVFRLYWEHTPLLEGNPVREDVYFVSRGDGVYDHAPDQTAPGAVLDLVTGSTGELQLTLPYPFEGRPPEGGLYLSELRYEETGAPDNVERPLAQGSVGSLAAGIYKEIPVENRLKMDKETLSISVAKSDGKSRLGLSGAEFQLFTVLDLGGSDVFEIPLAAGVTDQQGNLTFDKRSDGKPLELGETYYLRETRAPEGYVLDETVHKITLDESHLDESLHFVPVVLALQNYKLRGAVHLTKVAAEDPSRGLSGAEFELFRQTEESGGLDEAWEHYGRDRYVTGENGELLIEDLPYGSYRLVERAAPLGYVLDHPVQALEFQIDGDQAAVELGQVENRLDPNPARDVLVKKVAAEDPSAALSGAEFELYGLKEDGEYHLLRKDRYVTGEDGTFTIGMLPVGTYALKELKAPAGYEVPEQNMTYFTVNVEDRRVELQIENARSSGGDGGDGTVSVTVQKVWKDQGSAGRPDSVEVQLYGGGSAYGDPVRLDAEGLWTHTWTGLDPDVDWAVDEPRVPSGYIKNISRTGSVWTITNQRRGGDPGGSDDSDDSDDSGDSDGHRPVRPVVPGGPGGPGVPKEPSQPGTQEYPEGTEPFSDHQTTVPAETDPDPSRETVSERLPETGDSSRTSLWLALLCMSAAGLGLVWKLVRRAEEDKKDQEQS